MQPITYISGATGFAGSMIADHLARQGVDLLVSAKDSEKINQLVKDLTKRYPNVKIKGFSCDVSQPDFWEIATSYTKDLYIQNYINCTGIQGQLGPSSEISYQEMLRVFNVNLFSSIYFSNLFANKLQPNQKLSIVLFSGGGSTGPRPLFMPYSLSKTSLLRFVENFAAENLNENIRINAVAPGVMPSRMQEEVLHSPGMEKSQDYLVAVNSLVDENLEYTKLLELCDFLISHKSQGITGKLINSNWDNWPEWPNHLIELESSDLYTLRRITSRDRGKEWGDL
jgi:3-oxoacyl-[acyl-carrier protein] reductase